MCYKIVRGMVDVNLSDFFTLSGSSITRGHCYKISFHHCRVNVRLNFFSNRVIAVWNSLYLKLLFFCLFVCLFICSKKHLIKQ